MSENSIGGIASSAATGAVVGVDTALDIAVENSAELLFDEVESSQSTGNADSFVKGTNGADSAQAAQQTEQAPEVDVDKLLTELASAEAEYSEALTDCTGKYDAYDAIRSDWLDATKAENDAWLVAVNLSNELATAKEELANLEDDVFFVKWFTGGKREELENKIAQLEKDHKAACEEYQAKMDERKELAEKKDEARTAYFDAIRIKNDKARAVEDLKAQITAAGGTVPEVETPPAEEVPADETTPVDGEATTPTDGTTVEEPKEEVSLLDSIKNGFSEEQIQKAAEALGINIASFFGFGGLDSLSQEDLQQISDFLIDEQTQQQIQHHAEQRAQEFKKVQDDLMNGDFEAALEFMHSQDFEMIGRLGDLSNSDVITLLNEYKEAYQADLMAITYAKSGSMAKSDTATAEEHQNAEADFASAVLQISDVVNSPNVEFFNLSDQSNYELSMSILDRINSGEYIKTDALEKQTSAVQNIQFTKVSHESVNDEKYTQFSNAILDKLQGMISDEQGAEMSEHKYNSIESQFKIMAAKDPEAAFKFLEEEAMKYKINEAIAEE